MELRSELERLGHSFYTATDTETIVHLYEEHGARCVTKLRGMFTFALWDERERTVLLARDRLGIKALFYAVVEGRARTHPHRLARPGAPDRALLGFEVSAEHDQTDHKK